jgi:hypothetical protein
MTSRNFFLPRDDVTEKQEIEYQIMIPFGLTNASFCTKISLWCHIQGRRSHRVHGLSGPDLLILLVSHQEKLLDDYSIPSLIKNQLFLGFHKGNKVSN